MTGSMGPPPLKNPSPPLNSDAADAAVDDAAGDDAHIDEASGPISDAVLENESPKKCTPYPSPSPRGSSSSHGFQQATIPYTIPPWSEPPEHPFSLEILKDGTIVEQLDVYEKGAYMFGRLDLCDFVLEHPTISRFHAVLQFKKDGTFIYDLDSTHGTFVNKKQVKGKVYTEIHVGDVLRFGHSSRLYIFQGPSELMPPEGELHKIRKIQSHEALRDREASLLRAKEAAFLANGISWGMAEDAIEEDPENDADEITWQTYKGQFTERQEKTRSKIIKRTEKVSNMKKEIDAIRAKDISQGGLTPGQQMQIGRNEQRIAQIMEELDSLEETLNDSIRESKGARAGRSVGGRTKANAEEEENNLSDDDEFYDRTKKLSAKKSGEQQSVETADTLLDKMEVISGEIEEKKKLLAEEKEKIASNEKGNNGEDELDAYMSGLSSQLVIDRTSQMEKKLSDLQAELNRITYLLKIADPTGEATRKRASNSTETQAPPKSNQSVPSISRQCQSNEKSNPLIDNLKSRPSLEETCKLIPAEKPSEKADGASLEETCKLIPAEKPSEKAEGACENKEDKTLAYTIAKPQWLGATRKIESEDLHIAPANLAESASDDFVDYSDRKKFLSSVDNDNLETAAPGLILRKRKSTEKANNHSAEKAQKVEIPSSTSSPKAETIAADAVALLLKHKRGINVVDELTAEKQSLQVEGQSGKENSHVRRVLGPARPDFLDGSSDYESWVPPKGQTGDGRTSLNDRLGY